VPLHESVNDVAALNVTFVPDGRAALDCFTAMTFGCELARAVAVP
jgi:hypothetical protein